MTIRTIAGPLIVKPSDDGKFHISYTPATTQILQAGKEYEFVFDNVIVEGQGEEKKNG